MVQFGTMLHHLFSSIVLCLILNVVNGKFPNVYRNIERQEVQKDLGEPLILTPLIEENKIEEAQAAAEVNSSLFLGIKSYAGYLTVNEEHNSNLFFWFFPSEKDYENDPVILWLEGGPGATTFYGVFEGNGPFSVNSNLELGLREYSWTKSHSVLYIDNPIGTGYSFTTGGYAQNETKIGNDLYNSLIQFFSLFPELQEREFYITGESYGGKYVPAIAYRILKENENARLKINLKGLAIGNGLCDPEHQLNYGDYLFQLGLVDSNTKEKFKEQEREVVAFIQQGDFQKAYDVFEFGKGGSIFYNATGFYNNQNYLYPKGRPGNDVSIAQFVQSAEIRSTIHVGSARFEGLASAQVFLNLESDIMQSVAPWISELLNHYRILFYNGQLDIVVAYPLTVNFLQNLKFSGDEEYKTAKRYIWHVDEEIAGYVKQAGNLTEVLVRNAGHTVIGDQPKWAADLISRFIRNQLLHEKQGIL